MIKRFYYFTLILVGLLTAVSCSKNSNSPAKEVANSYSGTSLVAYNGGTDDANLCPNAEIAVKAIDNNNVELELLYCVSGYESYKMNAQVIKTKAGENYTITGSSTKDGVIKVDFTGTVVNNALTATIKNTILATDVAKDWTINAASDGDAVYDFLNFVLTTKSGTVNMPSMDSDKVPTDQFNESMKGICNMILGMGLQNAKLSLQSDGYVSFSALSPFATGGSMTSPVAVSYKNITKYSYNPATKVLTFEVPLSSFVKASNTSQASAIFYLNFYCSFENGIMTANLDEATTKMLLAMIPTGDTLQAYLSKLDSVVPTDYAAFLPTIKSLITEIVGVITSSDVTSLVIGGKLVPVK